MTRDEFILQAMLQMAANPKYVKILESEDDEGNATKFPSIDEECIYIDAEALAKEAEKRMYDPFDKLKNPTDESNGYLNTIADNIEEHLDKLDVIADALEQYIKMKM